MEDHGDILEAEDLGTRLLKLLESKDVCPDVAMAALGDAFIRMLHGLRVGPDEVEEIMIELATMYRRDYKGPYAWQQRAD